MHWVMHNIMIIDDVSEEKGWAHLLSKYSVEGSYIVLLVIAKLINFLTGTGPHEAHFLQAMITW